MLRRISSLLLIGICGAFWLRGSSWAGPAPQEKLTLIKGLLDIPLEGWRYRVQNRPEAISPRFDDSSWPEARIGHEWWPENSICWFRKKITFPEKVNGCPVSGLQAILKIAIDDDGEIWVDGHLKQRFHWDEGRIVLSRKVVPGETRVVVVKGINGPVHGRLLGASISYDLTGNASSGLAAYLQTLQLADRLKTFWTDRKEQIAQTVSASLDALDGDALLEGDRPRLAASLGAAWGPLKPLSEEIKRLEVHMIGNAHIDQAWLWRWRETVDVCKNTFSSVLSLMESYSDLKYTQSQANVYAWMERYDPDLFGRIRQAVREGRWCIVGGMWVEPDVNMPSGESLSRQLLYGQQYFQERFGQIARTGYNPDTFGHPWTLPQILHKGGLDTYYLGRGGKGSPLFWWESPDGSRVLAYNRGWYTGDPLDERMAEGPIDLQKRFDVPASMHFFGMGDHGGGPTREQIERILTLNRLPLMPTLRFSTPDIYFAEALSRAQNLPVVNTELNPVFEGCYTTQSDQKRNNRKAEVALFGAEVFSSVAAHFGLPYPRTSLTDAWKKTLFNQFHDLLPGSGIHAIYEDAQEDYNAVFREAGVAQKKALTFLSLEVNTLGNRPDPPLRRGQGRAGQPIVVFNPLSWARTDAVHLILTWPKRPTSLVLRDSRGRLHPIQILATRQTPEGWQMEAIFVAEEVPSMGYRAYRVLPGIAPTPQTVFADETSLENEFLRARFDPKTGLLVSLYDKIARKECLARPGNLLQALEDRGNAWVINYTGKSEDLTGEATVRLVERGPVKAKIRITRRWRDSQFVQDVAVYRKLPRLEVELKADWKERHVLLKVAFPLPLTQPEATFEIPYGSITRPADGHEAVGQQWVDVSDTTGGVSLLNDCKYGFDIKGNVLRMTLLRGSTDPDPQADIGHHQMHYALYPHRGSWQTANTLRRGREFNHPLIAINTTLHSGRLPSEGSFLSIDPKNIVLSALKKAESSDDLILRVYEAEGKATLAEALLLAPAVQVLEDNLIEMAPRPLKGMKLSGRKLQWSMVPYEIKTLRIRLALPSLGSSARKRS